MAITTADITTAFTVLMTDIKDILADQQDNHRIDQQGFASVLAQSITNAQSLAVEFALNRDLKDAEIAYTTAKETVTLESRLDNLLIEDMKAQQLHLATVGAGGLTVSAADFAAANALRNAVYLKAQNKDISDVTHDIAFNAGSAYVVAT
jgi:hypothetical protein